MSVDIFAGLERVASLVTKVPLLPNQCKLATYLVDEWKKALSQPPTESTDVETLETCLIDVIAPKIEVIEKQVYNAMGIRTDVSNPSNGPTLQSLHFSRDSLMETLQTYCSLKEVEFPFDLSDHLVQWSAAVQQDSIFRDAFFQECYPFLTQDMYNFLRGLNINLPPPQQHSVPIIPANVLLSPGIPPAVLQEITFSPADAAYRTQDYIQICDTLVDLAYKENIHALVACLYLRITHRTSNIPRFRHILAMDTVRAAVQDLANTGDLRAMVVFAAYCTEDIMLQHLYCRHAATCGDTNAQYLLARKYIAMRDRSYTWRGLVWLSAASEAGHRQARTDFCTYLMSENDIGPDVPLLYNPQLAVHMAFPMALQGDARACYLLAKAYFLGTTVCHHLQAAYGWICTVSQHMNEVRKNLRYTVAQAIMLGGGVVEDSDAAEVKAENFKLWSPFRSGTDTETTEVLMGAFDDDDDDYSPAAMNTLNSASVGALLPHDL